MTWPAHIHLSFGGPFWTEDIWSMNLTFARDVVPAAPWRNTLPTNEGDAALWCADNVDDLAQTIKNWWVTVGSGASTQALLKWVKCVVMVPDPDDGWRKMYSPAHGVTPLYEFSTGQVASGKGTITLVAPPPQIATALSWRGDKTRGTGANGRAFLPSGIFQMNAGTPYINGATAAAVIGAFKTFIADLETGFSSLTGDGGANARHCIVTPGSQKTGEAGSVQSVNVYRMGNRHDVIRSRANKFRETYTEVEV